MRFAKQGRTQTAVRTADNTEEVPIYVEVAEVLEGAIFRGDYAPGDRLPTELALAREHGINRHTAARALNRLQSRGLVHRVERRGTYVNAERLEYPLLEAGSFAASIYRASRRPSHEILDIRRTRAFGRVAKQMGVPDGEPLVVFDQVNFSEGSPVAYLTKYFRADLLPDPTGFLEHYPSLKSLLKSRHGLELFRARMTLQTAAADEDVSRRLGVPMGATLLVAEDLHVLDDGTPAQWTISHIRPEAMKLSIEVREVRDEREPRAGTQTTPMPR